MNNQNDKYIEKITGDVLLRYHDSEYSINELASETGMNRFQIHRHLKSSLGLSFSQFLMLIRIMASLKLLLETDGNVSEIGYKVGFSSPAYFSKCFVGVYGTPPGQVMRSGNSFEIKNEYFRKTVFHPVIRSRLKEDGFILPAENIKTLNMGVYRLPVLAVVATIFLVSILFAFYHPNRLSTATYAPDDNLFSMLSFWKPGKENINLTIYAFDQRGPDYAELSWMKRGLPIALKEDLGQLPEINVRWKEVSELRTMSELSQLNNDDYFVTGDWEKINGLLTVKCQIFSLKTNKTETFQVSGDNIFNVVDQLTPQVLSVIDFQPTNTYVDLPVAGIFTGNEKALEYYSRAVCDNFPNCFPSGNICKYLSSAIVEDPSFTSASYDLAKYYYGISFEPPTQNRAIRQAMVNRDKVPASRRAQIVSLNHRIQNEIEKSRALLENQLRTDPENLEYMDERIDLEINNNNYPLAILLLSKRLGIAGDLSKEHLYVNLLLLERRFEEADDHLLYMQKNYGNLLEIRDLRLHFLLMTRRLSSAWELKEEMEVERPESAKGLGYLVDHFTYMETGVRVKMPEGSPYEGLYHAAHGERINITDFGDYLFFKPKNRFGYFLFPAGNDIFVMATHSGGERITFKRDIMNKVYMANTDFYYEAGFMFLKFLPFYKLDQNLKDAFELFEEENNMEALRTFYKARESNPSHTFIDYYIQHLEYIQSDSFFIGRFSNLPGDYFYDSTNALATTLEITDNKFYLNKNGSRRRQYPISAQTFITYPEILISSSFKETEGLVTGNIDVIYAGERIIPSDGKGTPIKKHPIFFQ